MKIKRTLMALILFGCGEDTESPDPVVLGAGAIVVEPTSLDFGESLLQSTQIQWLTITNEGDDLLQIFDVQIADDSQRPHWSLTGGLSGFLEPGEAIGIEVHSHPITLDNPSTGLMIQSNDPDATEVRIPLLVEVYGEASIRLIPDDVVEFGHVAVGDSESADVVIGNDGDASLYVQNVSLNETSSPFSIDIDPTGTTVHPQTEDGDLRIRFAPPYAGSFTEVITIETSDSSAGPQLLVVQGTGI